MNDDLERLAVAMKAVTPTPDPVRKDENLALARKNFNAHQAGASQPRQTSDHPETGFIRGVKSMIENWNMRGAFAATTALAAFALVLTVPDWRPVSPMAPVSFAQDEPRKSTTAGAENAPVPETAGNRTFDMTMEAAPQATQGDVAQAPQALSRAISPDAAVSAVQERHAVDPGFWPEADTEVFSSADPNPVRVTAEDPVSTFSVDVDTASYALIRSSLMRGALPPKDAVRIEEMVNYFPYDYPMPAEGEAFRPTVSVTQTPWNPDTQLVHIAIQGAQPAVADRPALNLVFLVDTSGSMQAPGKLPLLKQSLALMLPQLTDRDEVAIVAYAGQAGEVLAPTPATDRAAIRAALEGLDAGGGTAGQAGLQQAYALAQSMTAEGEVSRVILATDGDFNIGLSDPEALKDYIADQRDSGVYLSVMGFGRGNLDDATMQALAQNGNGVAGYIDTLSEAQKVMVDQLSGALFPIADDVKVQVEFNPARIAEYRLIGYETRTLRREDFANDQVDAGDIGAGHQVTALYEVTPVGSPARLTEPLRYSADPAVPDASDEMGFLRLRYKAPGQEDSSLLTQPIVETGTVSDEIRFAAAIAGFGQILRGDPYLGDWDFAQAIALAGSARAEDTFGYRAEALQLMRLAQSLSR